MGILRGMVKLGKEAEEIMAGAVGVTEVEIAGESANKRWPLSRRVGEKGRERLRGVDLNLEGAGE